jgi:hypothetical protein
MTEDHDDPSWLIILTMLAMALLLFWLIPGGPIKQWLVWAIPGIVRWVP